MESFIKRVYLKWRRPLKERLQGSVLEKRETTYKMVSQPGILYCTILFPLFYNEDRQWLYFLLLYDVSFLFFYCSILFIYFGLRYHFIRSF